MTRPMMKTISGRLYDMKQITAIVSLVALSVTLSCASLRAPKPVSVVSCMMTDEWLKMGFEDPNMARVWLNDLITRLETMQPEAAADAMELASRILECLNDSETKDNAK